METLKKVIKIRENLENQKKSRIFVVLKETKVLTVPRGIIKNINYEARKYLKKTYGDNFKIISISY